MKNDSECHFVFFFFFHICQKERLQCSLYLQLTNQTVCYSNVIVNNVYTDKKHKNPSANLKWACIPLYSFLTYRNISDNVDERCLEASSGALLELGIGFIEVGVAVNVRSITEAGLGANILSDLVALLPWQYLYDVKNKDYADEQAIKGVNITAYMYIYICITYLRMQLMTSQVHSQLCSDILVVFLGVFNLIDMDYVCQLMFYLPLNLVGLHLCSEVLWCLFPS